MINVVLMNPYGPEFVEHLHAVDPRIAVREMTEPLRLYMRGELPDDASVREQALQDAAEILTPMEVMVGWARFPPEALQWADNLKWIQVTSAGVDRLDKRVMDRVILTNGNGLTAEPIAEHVIGMTLMLARNSADYIRQQSKREWKRNFNAREIAGMTMGVVGMGAIGSAIARKARAMGMRVIGLRRSVSERMPDLTADEVCPPSDLNYLLEASDVVTLATPLTAETRGMIGARELANMRPGSYLINIARGAVVDEDALVESLRSGHLAGAGLDVFRQEPCPESSPLWDFPNVIMTPHVATGSDRNILRVRELICDNLRRYIDGQPLRNLVDPERGY